MAEIVERTDGIPLFVEEMTKAVLEAQGEGKARQTVAMSPSPALSVPASLHASLMARLDRLGSAKELAQVGATIGREFSFALLTAVARRPEAELAESLDRLVRSGLTSRQGSPPDATYVFKHSLVQDAAYGTLLREPRRALHARIAEALEKKFTEIAENQPELLARHCSEAGLSEKAAGMWGKAGQRSLERSALVEAVEQLTRAIGLIAALAPTTALRREEIKLQVALITPLLHVKGYAAPETKAAAERANLLIEQATALGEPLEDPLLLYSVLYGVWVANYIAFNGDAMRELAAQFLVLAEKQGSVVPVVVAHRIMAVSLLYGGYLTSPSAFRPSSRASQPGRAPSCCHSIWPGQRGGDPGLSIAGLVVARLSSGIAGGCRERGQGRPRDWAGRYFDVCPDPRRADAFGLQELRGSQGGSGRTGRSGGRKGRLFLENDWNGGARVGTRPDRQGFRRG
jgi:hypothetical protein